MVVSKPLKNRESLSRYYLSAADTGNANEALYS